MPAVPPLPFKDARALNIEQDPKARGFQIKPDLAWRSAVAAAAGIAANKEVMDAPPGEILKLRESLDPDIRDTPLNPGGIGNDYFTIVRSPDGRFRFELTKEGIQKIRAARKSRGEPPVRTGDSNDILWRLQQQHRLKT